MENNQPQVSLPSVIVIKADTVLKSRCYLLVGGVLLMVNGEGTQWTGGLGILLISSAWFERDFERLSQAISSLPPPPHLPGCISLPMVPLGHQCVSAGKAACGCAQAVS